MRKLAYRRYSEGRAAHWLILIAADRVDAAGKPSPLLATLHPDNPITETGVMPSFTAMASTHGSASIALMWCIRQWIQSLSPAPGS